MTDENSASAKWMEGPEKLTFSYTVCGSEKWSKLFVGQFSSIYHQKFHTEHTFDPGRPLRGFYPKESITMYMIALYKRMKNCEHYRTGWLNGNTLNKLQKLICWQPRWWHFRWKKKQTSSWNSMYNMIWFFV